QVIPGQGTKAELSRSLLGCSENWSGYESAAKDFVPDDLEVQVPGRAFLITGGNSGIGKATATEIAKRGGTVHLVCRNQSRAEGAKGEIIRESGNQNIFLHILDLSDPKKIWKFVETFKQEHTLNVLINNAGCMVNKRELTEDGLEKNFATNTLGSSRLIIDIILEQRASSSQVDSANIKTAPMGTSSQGLGMGYRGVFEFEDALNQRISPVPCGFIMAGEEPFAPVESLYYFFKNEFLEACYNGAGLVQNISIFDFVRNVLLVLSRTVQYTKRQVSSGVGGGRKTGTLIPPPPGQLCHQLSDCPKQALVSLVEADVGSHRAPVHLSLYNKRHVLTGRTIECRHCRPWGGALSTLADPSCPSKIVALNRHIHPHGILLYEKNVYEKKKKRMKNIVILSTMLHVVKISELQGGELFSSALDTGHLHMPGSSRFLKYQLVRNKCRGAYLVEVGEVFSKYKVQRLKEGLRGRERAGTGREQRDREGPQPAVSEASLRSPKIRHRNLPELSPLGHNVPWPRHWPSGLPGMGSELGGLPGQGWLSSSMRTAVWVPPPWSMAPSRPHPEALTLDDRRKMWKGQHHTSVQPPPLYLLTSQTLAPLHPGLLPNHEQRCCRAASLALFGCSRCCTVTLSGPAVATLSLPALRSRVLSPRSREAGSTGTASSEALCEVCELGKEHPEGMMPPNSGALPYSLGTGGGGDPTWLSDSSRICCLFPTLHGLSGDLDCEDAEGSKKADQEGGGLNTAERCSSPPQRGGMPACRRGAERLTQSSCSLGEAALSLARGPQEAAAALLARASDDVVGSGADQVEAPEKTPESCRWDPFMFPTSLHIGHPLLNPPTCRAMQESGPSPTALCLAGVYILTTALIPVLEKEHDPRVSGIEALARTVTLGLERSPWRLEDPGQGELSGSPLQILCPRSQGAPPAPPLLPLVTVVWLLPTHCPQVPCAERGTPLGAPPWLPACLLRVGRTLGRGASGSRASCGRLRFLEKTLCAPAGAGGMLVQKLNISDLQSERTAFNGTMVYAQNKVSGSLRPAFHPCHTDSSPRDLTAPGNVPCQEVVVALLRLGCTFSALLREAPKATTTSRCLQPHRGGGVSWWCPHRSPTARPDQICSENKDRVGGWGGERDTPLSSGQPPPCMNRCHSGASGLPRLSVKGIKASLGHHVSATAVLKSPLYSAPTAVLAPRLIRLCALLFVRLLCPSVHLGGGAHLCRAPCPVRLYPRPCPVPCSLTSKPNPSGLLLMTPNHFSRDLGISHGLINDWDSLQSFTKPPNPCAVASPGEVQAGAVYAHLRARSTPGRGRTQRGVPTDLLRPAGAEGETCALCRVLGRARAPCAHSQRLRPHLRDTFSLPCTRPHPVQRQQVVLTERWAQRHGAIHFSSMHPGWVDTPEGQCGLEREKPPPWGNAFVFSCLVCHHGVLGRGVLGGWGGVHWGATLCDCLPPGERGRRNEPRMRSQRRHRPHHCPSPGNNECRKGSRADSLLDLLPPTQGISRTDLLGFLLQLCPRLQTRGLHSCSRHPIVTHGAEAAPSAACACIALRWALLSHHLEKKKLRCQDPSSGCKGGVLSKAHRGRQRLWGAGSVASGFFSVPHRRQACALLASMSFMGPWKTPNLLCPNTNLMLTELVFSKPIPSPDSGVGAGVPPATPAPYSLGHTEFPHPVFSPRARRQSHSTRRQPRAGGSRTGHMPRVPRVSEQCLGLTAGLWAQTPVLSEGRGRGFRLLPDACGELWAGSWAWGLDTGLETVRPKGWGAGNEAGTCSPPLKEENTAAVQDTARLLREAVRQSMPGFHARFKDRLRSAAQGADTVLWLALSPAAPLQPSGQFFQGDVLPVCKGLLHLLSANHFGPLEWGPGGQKDTGYDPNIKFLGKARSRGHWFIGVDSLGSCPGHCTRRWREAQIFSPGSHQLVLGHTQFSDPTWLGDAQRVSVTPGGPFKAETGISLLGQGSRYLGARQLQAQGPDHMLWMTPAARKQGGKRHRRVVVPGRRLLPAVLPSLGAKLTPGKYGTKSVDRFRASFLMFKVTDLTNHPGRGKARRKAGASECWGGGVAGGACAHRSVGNGHHQGQQPGAKDKQLPSPLAGPHFVGSDEAAGRQVCRMESVSLVMNKVVGRREPGRAPSAVSS
ncbi:Dehydrogenase/reductase SDR family member 12, partial [Galemys pyrenaicus]